MFQYFSSHKIIAFILLFTSFHFVTSQNTRIVYKYKYKSNINKDTLKKIKTRYKGTAKGDTHDKIIKSIEIFNKSLEYELIYNNEESVFRISKEFNLEKSDYVSELLMESIYGSILSYKSKYVKYSIEETLTGKLLKVNYPVNYYKWKLTKKTKEILGYPCRLAVAENPVVTNKGVEYEKVYVWFTEKLHYTYGSQGFDNLPGVVLKTIIGSSSLTAVSIEKTDIFPVIPSPDKEITITDHIKNQKKFAEASMKIYNKKRK